MSTPQAISNDNMFVDYPDLLTIEDLRKALDISRSMAYKLINDGKIEHFRIGKVIKIPKNLLIDFILNSCYTDESSRSAVNEKGVDKK